MTSARIPVTAGPHEVVFTWIERPARDQNVLQPALRESQEAHNPAGLPRLRMVNIEGPYNVTGISETPSRKKLFVCKPTTAAKEAPCAAGDFLGCCATCLPSSCCRNRHRSADGFLQSGTQERR